MEVTLIPRDCKRTPNLLMEIPFPKPLTTPPVTIRYFIAFWYELFVASVRKRVGKRIPTIWEGLVCGEECGCNGDRML